MGLEKGGAEGESEENLVRTIWCRILTATATTTSREKTKRGLLVSKCPTFFAERANRKRVVYVPTSMAIQNLHDFAALQVPQVYFAVLAARHDPLAARDAEAGGDAVLGVLVTDVRLEAARGLKVPQPYRAVVRGGEYVFRVGRKLHVLATMMNLSESQISNVGGWRVGRGGVCAAGY